jgi:hypothetical protein
MTGVPGGETAVINSDGTGQTRLTFGAGGTPERFSGEPDWSPDGTRLVFSSDRDRSSYPPGSIPGPGDIFTMSSVDGSDVRHLTHPTGQDVDDEPAFTPDGRQILYVHSTGSESNLWVMGADGSGQRPLTTGGILGSFEYSPDGRRLLFANFTSTAPLRSILYVMDADGRNLRRLTEGFSPNWTPDGRSIVFIRETFESESVLNIWRLDLAAGASPVRITSSGPGGRRISTPDWCGPAPPPPPALGSDSLPPSVIIFGADGPVSTASARPRDTVALAGRDRTLSSTVRGLKLGAIDRTGVKSVDVSIARRTRGGCSFLSKSGFGRPSKCDRPRFVSLPNKPGSFDALRKFLRKGTYDLLAKAADTRGNRAARPAKLTLRITGK